MDITTPFKIEFLKIKTKNFAKKKELIIKELKKHPEERQRSFNSNRGSGKLSRPFSKIFSEELSQISFHGITITDTWSVTYDKGDFHVPHNHGSVGYAGILYLDLPEGSSVTNYIQPWNNIETDTTIYYPLPVSEGQIIVVPQFLQHFSPPHNAKKGKKRIISFDMSFVQGDNA